MRKYSFENLKFFIYFSVRYNKIDVQTITITNNYMI